MEIVRASLVGILALSLAGYAEAGTPSAAEARTASLRQYQAGDYRGAIASLDAVLAIHPHDFVSLVRRGNAYLHLDQPARALLDFNEAIFRRPDYAPSYLDRAVCLAMLGRDAEALRDYRSARLLDTFEPIEQHTTPSTLSDLHCGIGELYRNQGLFAPALREYHAALRLTPGNPAGFAGRGLTYAALGRLDLAMPDLDEAIRLRPRHSRALAARGYARAQLGQDEKALADLDAALAVDPSYLTALGYRAAVYVRTGQEGKALTDFDSVIRLDPRGAGGYKDRGGLLVRLGKADAALRDLDEAIRLDPRRASSFQNRAAAYNTLGQFERALTDGDESVRLAPRNAESRANRAVTNFNLGHTVAALADLDESIRLEPRNASTYRTRALAHTHLGHRHLAILDYAEAIRLEPRSVWVAGSSDSEDLDRLRVRASREYEIAQRIAPLGADALLDRGRLRRARGDWDGALADFHESLGLDPRRADAHAARGWTLLLANRDGAEADARAYLDLRGGRDPDAARIALLGHLASARAGHAAESRAFLDEGIANTPPGSWPSPVLRYLRRDLSATELLAAASDDSQRTEAHAQIGLDRLRIGDRLDALTHLRWVRDRGVKTSAESLLAVDALGRLERDASLE